MIDTKAFVTAKAIRRAVEIGQNAFGVFWLDDDTKGKMPFGWLVIGVNGKLLFEGCIGDTNFGAIQETQEAMDRYITIAHWKYNKTVETGMSTREILEHPEMLESEEDYLYAGSYINPAKTIVVSFSSLKGAADEAVSAAVGAALQAGALIERDKYIAAGGIEKNKGKIVFD